MWHSANVVNPPHRIYINEKSLTGNMDLSEMYFRRIKWETVDDKIKLGEGKISYKFNGEFIDLEPQRIRVFEVIFTPWPLYEDFLQ
jgi:hypothetical protein